MTRKKVAIVGAGISSLTTAYQLTRTAELRSQYDVTVYQFGWRLGGKLASGRDREKWDRNVEHGLHVWFGCYENAFAMFKELLDRWDSPPDCPFKVWSDAFIPQNLTPIGERIDGKLGYWPLLWPTNPAEPGEAGVMLSPWEAVVELIRLLKNIFDEYLEREAKGSGQHQRSLWDRIVDFFKRLFGGAKDVGKLIEHTLHTAKDILEGEVDVRGAGVTAMLDAFRAEAFAHLAGRAENDVDANTIRNCIDVGTAFIKGILNPKYGITDDWDLNRIDHLELREWLKNNGATPDVVDNWSCLRAVYDTFFQYQDGETDKPSFGAGTAARIFIRAAATFKGSVLYLVEAGMGETVIAPLYEVCKAQGVKFEFFHRLQELKLSDDGNEVTSLRFDRQVDYVDGTYNPTFVDDGLVCWPTQPFWEKIKDGAAMRDAGVNWESKWNAHAPAGETKLELGTDFDEVVLGISMGAFAKLNDQPSICQDLLDKKPVMRAMTENLYFIPSIGIQLWMKPNLKDLGWTEGKPAMVAWSYPNTVWADMTQVLRFEKWTGPDKPNSLHYLCGTLGTKLYREPTTNTGVPDAAAKLVYEQTKKQFTETTGSIWPKAVLASNPNELDWSLLCPPSATTGPERLKEQFLRANVDPTECCVGSPPNGANTRLTPDGSGVSNLFLTGSWIRTGLNATCVEGAVMAGMETARTMCGSPKNIVGELFMQAPAKKEN